VTPPRPLLEKFLGVMFGLSLGTSVSNFKSVALTVLSYYHLTPVDRPLRTHRQTDTSNERIISAIHFVHLAEIIIVEGSDNKILLIKIIFKEGKR